MKEVSAEFPLIEDRIENLQDVFNIVWGGAQNMKGQSKLPEYGTCAYRGLNGAKCFVGMCIENDTLAAEMDKLGAVSDVLSSYVEVGLPAWFKDLAEDLEALQEIHDDCFKDWEVELTNFAKRNKLTIPGPWVQPSSI